jgi:alpha-1,3-glucosyltransferase
MATLIAMSPSCIIALLQPDARNFLSSLFNTSMAFFLFSYQAHEKSILLPLLPITLLNAEYGYLSVWLITTASFSMVPLLWKDGLVLAYTVLQIGSILSCSAAFDCHDRHSHCARYSHAT